MCHPLATGPHRGSTRLLAHLALLDRMTADADADAAPAFGARERVQEALGPELAERLTRTLTQALAAAYPARAHTGL